MAAGVFCLQMQPFFSHCQIKDIKVVVCVAMTIRFQALEKTTNPGERKNMKASQGRSGDAVEDALLPFGPWAIVPITPPSPLTNPNELTSILMGKV